MEWRKISKAQSASAVLWLEQGIFHCHFSHSMRRRQEDVQIEGCWTTDAREGTLFTRTISHFRSINCNTFSMRLNFAVNRSIYYLISSMSPKHHTSRYTHWRRFMAEWMASGIEWIVTVKRISENDDDCTPVLLHWYPSSHTNRPAEARCKWLWMNVIEIYTFFHCLFSLYCLFSHSKPSHCVLSTANTSAEFQ